MLRLLPRACAALLLLLATVTPAAAAEPPLVLAAASLQEGLSAAADAWARKGHLRPVISFAASSALARQAAAGAPADLFLSADEEWMDWLAARRLIRPASRVSVLTNELVLVAPSASPIRLVIGPGFPLARALGQGRLALADPASVPAGIYAKEALTRLGVWPAVQGRIASAENVRAALALVTRGEAPLGVVYATDARAAPGVRVVGTFPAASHKPVTYPLALLATSRSPDAEPFRRFLLGGEARAIFRRFGFGTR
jgi:molybdate transport system substrate-binding protein